MTKTILDLQKDKAYFSSYLDHYLTTVEKLSRSGNIFDRGLRNGFSFQPIYILFPICVWTFLSFCIWTFLPLSFNEVYYLLFYGFLLYLFFSSLHLYRGQILNFFRFCVIKFISGNFPNLFTLDTQMRI